VDLDADAAALRSLGAEAFLRRQLAAHTCRDCGHLIDLHFGRCSGCGKQYPIGKGRAPV
jgi:lipopolysaccharide biosynthesis regulator YciM